MKTISYLTYLAFLTFLIAPLKAQSIQVSSHCSPNPLSSNSLATYTIIIKGSSQVSLPNFPDVPGLDIHFLGKGHTVQIINGQKQTELRLNYALKAKSTGTYTLPSLRLNIQNTVYELPSTTLTVLPSIENDILKQSGISLSIKLDQPKLYLGQILHCEVTLKVPTGIQGSILSDKPLLMSDALQELPNLPTPKETHGQDAGQSYQTIIWQRALKASKAGVYPVQYELPLSLRLQSTKNNLNTLFDDHFIDPLSLFKIHDEEVLVESPQSTLEVLDLPAEGRPQDFSGYIGTLSPQVVQTSLMDPEVGDPVTLKLVLTGSGDLDSLPAPRLKAHKGIKTYPAKETLLPEPPPSNQSSKLIEYILIPQEAGTLALPPLELTYFNPQTSTYEHLSCPIPTLIVQNSSLPYQAPKLPDQPAPPAPALAEPPPDTTLPSSCPLQPRLGKLEPSILPAYLWSKTYWQTHLILTALIASACLLRGLYKRRHKQSVTTKAATLMELLDAAKDAAIQEDSPHFFAILEKILRLSSPEASQASVKNLEAFLSSHGASADILSTARQLWDLADSYRFGGGISSQTRIQTTYKSLETLTHFLKTCLL